MGVSMLQGEQDRTLDPSHGSALKSWWTQGVPCLLPPFSPWTIFSFCPPILIPLLLGNQPLATMASSVFPLPSTFSPLTQLVVWGRHSPLDGDRQGAQFTALGHDDIEKATPETGY